MRNSKLSLMAMVAMFVLVAGVAYALGQKEQPAQQGQQPPPAPPPQQTTTTQTPPPPPAEVKPPEGGESAGEPDDPKAPQRFVPTQKTSADNNATFPVDI